jgi:DNA-binding response OmpR family regulator
MKAPFIMLVDDEVDFVESTSTRLQKRNFRTISAASGEQCLEKLAVYPEVDVIVLDVRMPGMDGAETLKKIKEVSPLIEVIMLTGHATVESGIEGLKRGAFDYLVKPCQIEELVAKITAAAQKRRAHENKGDGAEHFMETSTLRELMVPLSQYASVSEDASIFEAVNALEEAQNTYHPGRYRHRAVLVLGKGNRVTGKLSQHDIIQALEPQRSGDIALQKSAHDHFGFSRSFIASASFQFDAWDRPLQNLYRKAMDQKVKTFMHTPTKGEYVEITETINETIHRLILGKHHSLLVTENGIIVGIVRLTDVFELIHHRLKALQLAAKIGGSNT